MKKITFLAIFLILSIALFGKSKNTVLISDDNFQKEVIESKQIVLVDFWAPWCGPCKKLGPIIEELAEKHKDKMKFGKLNVDNNKKTAGKYGIRSIPTVGIFKEGKPIDGFVGLKNKDEIEKILLKHLKVSNTKTK